MAWIFERRLSYELSISNLFKVTKQRTLVFIIPEITHNEEHILYMATTAAKLGHTVHIITCRCTIYFPTINTSNIKLHVVGGFIPKTIKGYLEDVLYVVGSLYACMWLFFRKWSIRPNFVISQGPLTILPILKEIGNFHIVHYYTFNELHLVKLGSHVENPEWEASRLVYADEIVISSKLGRSVFHDVFPSIKNPVVFYQCVDTPSFDSCCPVNINHIVKITTDAIIFVCFGPMQKNSNFELAIEAFSLLLEETRRYDTMTYINLFLIIASPFKNTNQYMEYQTQLHYLAQKLCRSKSSVILLNNASLAYRKSLLERATAVIFPAINETYLEYKSILEAGYMGKPVIGPSCGMANEMIIQGVNGFLVPPNARDFSNCMKLLLYDGNVPREISCSTYSYFRRNFSEVRFAHELQGLIVRNSTR